MVRLLTLQGSELRGLDNGDWTDIRWDSCTEVPATFADRQQLQQHLTRLSFVSSERLTELPDSISKLTQLRHLSLHDCKQLKTLLDAVGQLTQLKTLLLVRNHSMTSLTDSVTCLTQLEQLSLEVCWRLSSLPAGFGQLTALTSLDLSGCSRLLDLPDDIGLSMQLMRLSLKGCTQLSSLPSSIGQLTNLKRLSLRGCMCLSSIPDSISHLTQLQHLGLDGCNSLLQLPGSIGQLTGLKRLGLDGCKSLRNLPDSVLQLTALEQLFLKDCSSLVILPNIGQLAGLTELSLTGCSSLTRLPHNVGQLFNLAHLSLWGCACLSKLPNSFGQLKALTFLDLSDCSSIHDLQDSIGQLSSLKKLHMCGSSNLSRVPRGVSSLTNLEQLNLSSCAALSSLADTLPWLPRLTSLKLQGCSSLQSLPELHKNALLEKLNLVGCSSLVRVPETVGQLCNLESLDLSGCNTITALPMCMSEMSSLIYLRVQCCYSLKTLPEQFAPNVKDLDLSYCREVESLAESLLRIEKCLVRSRATLYLEGWGEICQELSGDWWNTEVQFDSAAALALRRMTTIQRLLDDQESVLELLSRLSWLGVLLGAATFTAALAPPGGYDSGLLFLSYSAADCSSGDHAAAYSSQVQCITAGSRQNCTISDADPGGCVKRPDACTSIEGASCSVQPSQPLLLWFFVFDLLSFGLSMTLVMFVVACSIPRTGRSESRAAAGLIWLSLVVASGLLISAVVSGMLALLLGLLAVYPLGLRAWLWWPWCMSAGLMLLMVMLLLVRWKAIYPGPAAVKAALCSLVPKFIRRMLVACILSVL